METYTGTPWWSLFPSFSPPERERDRKEWTIWQCLTDRQLFSFIILECRSDTVINSLLHHQSHTVRLMVRLLTSTFHSHSIECGKVESSTPCSIFLFSLEINTVSSQPWDGTNGWLTAHSMNLRLIDYQPAGVHEPGWYNLRFQRTADVTGHISAAVLLIPVYSCFNWCTNKKQDRNHIMDSS